MTEEERLRRVAPLVAAGQREGDTQPPRASMEAEPTAAGEDETLAATDPDRGRPSKWDDEDDGRGLLGPVLFLFGLIYRLLVLVGILWLIAWGVLRTMGDSLPPDVAALLEAFVSGVSGLASAAWSWIAGLFCGAFGLFCAASVITAAPEPVVDPEPTPVVVETPVCAANETLMDGACVCDFGFERDGAGACAEPELEIDRAEAIAPPPPPSAPEPEPEPVYNVNWASSGDATGGARHWRYGRVEAAGALLPDIRSFCDAPLLIVLGVASADNATGQNERLSASRAARLGEALAGECGNAIPIWQASLGGYQSTEDRHEQRRPLLARVESSIAGAQIPREKIETLLCEADAQRALDNALGPRVSLNRYAAFAQDDVCQTGWRGRLAPYRPTP